MRVFFTVLSTHIRFDKSGKIRDVLLRPTKRQLFQFWIGKNDSDRGNESPPALPQNFGGRPPMFNIMKISLSPNLAVNTQNFKNNINN